MANKHPPLPDCGRAPIGEPLKSKIKDDTYTNH